MNKKKEILKKYIGKGGPKAPTPFEMIGGGLKNLRNKVQSGITRGITNFIGDTPAGRIIKSGLESQKKGILQKTTMPLINTQKRMPLNNIPKMPKAKVNSY